MNSNTLVTVTCSFIKLSHGFRSSDMLQSSLPNIHHGCQRECLRGFDIKYCFFSVYSFLDIFQMSITATIRLNMHYILNCCFTQYLNLLSGLSWLGVIVIGTRHKFKKCRIPDFGDINFSPPCIYLYLYFIYILI